MTPPFLTMELTGRPVCSFDHDHLATLTRWVAVLLVLNLVGGAIGLWVLTHGASTSANTPATDALAVPAATTDSLLPLDRLTRASTRDDLYFTTGGRLEALLVARGERVRRGQILAVVEDDALRRRLGEAEQSCSDLQVQVLETERRVRHLERKGDAETERAAAELSGLQDRYQQLGLEIDGMTRRLDASVLRAPVSGRVAKVYVSVGDQVSPRHPVVELTGDGPLTLEFVVLESKASHLSAGDVVPLPFRFGAAEGLITNVADLGSHRRVEVMVR